LWFLLEVLAVVFIQFSRTFTFPGSGAVKRFVITTLVTQVSSTNNKYEAAKGVGKITE